MEVRKAFVNPDWGREAGVSINAIVNWVLPQAVSGEIHRTDGVDKIFLDQALHIAGQFAATVGKNRKVFTNELYAALKDGTAIKLIRNGGSVTHVDEDQRAIVTAALRSFVATKHVEYGKAELDQNQRTLRLARDISTSESLYDEALSTNIVGNTIATIGEQVREFRSRYELLSVDDREKKALLSLFQKVVRLGGELPFVKEERTKHPPLVKLLPEAGTHATDLAGYIRTLMNVFSGKGSKELRNWLPGGKYFSELQRQRERWGNSPFKASAEDELDPVIAFEILQYFAQEEGLNEEDGLAKLDLFVAECFSN